MQATSKRGKHKNSLANLQKGRGTLRYGEAKKKHEITVTPSGWIGLQELAIATECGSISELLEKLGRGELSINSSS